MIFQVFFLNGGVEARNKKSSIKKWKVVSSKKQSTKIVP